MILDTISLKVDDLEWSTITYRYSFVEGFPGGSPELILHHPELGEMKLTDHFKLELKTNEGNWRKTTLREVTQLVTQAIQSAK